MRNVVRLGLCFLVFGCLTRAVPTERTYVDPSRQIFQLITLAVADVEGRVVGSMEQSGTVTAEIPADVAGLIFYLDVRVERRGFDEVVVQARVHGGREEADAELRERIHDRFFAALDALADRFMTRARGPRAPAPETSPTPAPWPGAPGRG